MELDSLKEIPKTFKIVKIALFASISFCLLLSIGCMFWSYMISTRYLNRTYLITNDGKAVIANSMSKYDVDQHRKPEIINHIKEFHKLFFEIDQFNYQTRVNKSLYLIGNSGKDLYKTLQAKRHYSHLASNNLKHIVKIDSIVVNNKTYPYRGAFYGKVIIKRTDQRLQNEQRIFSNFELTNVNRTEENPHGLLIENYIIRGF